MGTEVAVEACAIEQSLRIVSVTQIVGQTCVTHGILPVAECRVAVPKVCVMSAFEVVFRDGVRRVLVSV